MARKTANAHLYELAKIGAQTQLRDLLQEVTLLVDLFPHLRDSIDADELPVNFILERGRNRADARKTPEWTAAKRQAVAARMKKYRATRRQRQKENS